MRIKAFLIVFAWPELKTMLSRYLILILLILLILISLLCIGFNNATSTFLKSQMDNPFVKFISITKPDRYKNDSNYIEDINKSLIKKKFGIKDFELVPTQCVTFQGLKKQFEAFIRPIKVNSELYSFLTKTPDIVKSKKLVDISTNKWSCIVSRNYLFKLGYNNINVPYIYYVLADNNNDILVPIPIAAVVNSLPDNYDMLVSDELFNAMRFNYDPNPLFILDPIHINDLYFYISTDKKIEDIKEELKFNNINFLDIKPSFETCIEGYIVRINIGHQNSLNVLKNVKHKLKKYTIIRRYYFDANFPDIYNPPAIDEDKIILNMSTLENIEALQYYLKSKHKLTIDMNTVESKKKFDLFDKISKLLSIFLNIFSFTLIVYIISTLILEHIEKNKKSLGTLKAFGLSNKNIIILYSGIAFVLISSIFTISYIISYIVGPKLTSWVLIYNKIKFSTNLIIFDLSLSWSLVLLFIVLPILATNFSLYIKLRKKTPGFLLKEGD